MISFHLNTSDLHLHHVYCWFQEGDDNGSTVYISRLITRCVNSPIVWEGGRRKSSCFSYADWLVLDFDDGLDLATAAKEFEGYTHVIGTTKSHQKPKGKDRLVCDRFRVWLRLDMRCHSLEDYTYTIKKLALKYGADSQAIDGARKFLPCGEIVSIRKGRLLRIETKVEVKIYTAPVDLPHRFIPKFIRDMLDNGVANGSRNYSCYTISKYLHKNGFGEQEVYDLIMSSPIPSSSSAGSEVRSAVRNGCRG